MLPNILTTFRLIIIPFFAYSILSEQSVLISVSLFLLSGFTDVVDGWIARRFNMITDIGRVYDPLVDKLMQITAVVCLSFIGKIPLWVICFVLLKELTMIIVGSILYAKKIVVQSNWYGKSATVYFYTVIFVFIIYPGMSDVVKFLLSVSLVAVLIWAAIAYLIKFLKNQKEFMKARQSFSENP